MSKSIVILKNQIRGYVSDLTSVAQTAIEKHETKPLASLAMATAISAYGPLAKMKKYGKTIVTVKGDGPLKNIIVESNTEGDIRALVGNPHVVTEYDETKLNEIPIELGIGTKGILKIVHEINGKTFGGQVTIAKGDVVTDLAYYFDQSEQVYSAVQTSVILESATKVKKAFSVIFQLLPKHNEEDTKLIESIIQNNSIAKYDSIDEYIDKIKFDILDAYELRWNCSCSKDKIRQALKSITPAERKEIIAELGKLEVTCNFCNKKYDFTDE